MSITYTITRTTGNNRTVSFNVSPWLMSMMLFITYTYYKKRIDEQFARSILIEIGEIWAQCPDIRPK